MDEEEQELQAKLAALTEQLMDCLNDLDVGTLEYVKSVCDMVIASKSWNV